MRKHLFPSLMIACAMAMPVLAQDASNQHAGPRDGTGPERVEGQDGMTGDQMLGNRDDSQTRNLTRGDADQKVDAILDQIKQSPDKAGEKLFALGAAMGNQWEIAFSQLAEQKAQDPQVKELARMIREDHQKAQQKLMGIAREMNLDLPTSLPTGKQKKLDVLASLPPEKFDACYVLMLKADHAMAITSYADHQVALEDQQLKSYIAEVLPRLKAHGQQVMQVAQAKNLGSDTIALGGVSSDSNMMGNTDQAQDREVNRNPGSNTTDTNRKPTDTNPPR